MTPARSRFRWVALALTMLVNVPVQILWISYSAVTPQAASYYHVGDYAVLQLSMLFMAVYVVASIPASWLIDTRGVHRAVGLGALLVGACGLLRGVGGHSYPVALAATIGIALGQPLILNAWTAMPAHWFAPHERAGAVGLTTVANVVGAAIGLVVPPLLLGSMDIGRQQTLYGAIALAAGILYAVFYREGARVVDESGKALVLGGMKHALSMKAFWLLLACAFVCMGVFNGLTSLTAEILAPHGLGATEAGNVGAALLVGGVLGAVVIPHLSDKAGRRVPFIAAGMTGGAIGLTAMAYASSAVAFYVVSAFVGLCMVPLLPIAMEYAAELVHPTPDGTSNGIVQIAGQASVVVVNLLWALRSGDGSFSPGLLLLAGLLLAGAVLGLRLLPEMHENRRLRAEAHHAAFAAAHAGTTPDDAAGH